MKTKYLIKRYLMMILLTICLSGCYQEQAVPVGADFSLSVEHEYYTVPARIFVENKSSGADEFLWTFEGGEPVSSDKRNPEPVLYRNAGIYIVRLEAWNNDERKIKEYTLKLDSAVIAGFVIEIQINDISPVQAVIRNTSSGGTTYAWTFAGGIPASSDSYNPPPVIFTEPGEHLVSLEISNGREIFRHSRTLTVKPAASIDFDMQPSFENENMEAPLTAILTNKSINGLNYKWKSVGGTIDNDTATLTTKVHFALPGEYLVTLEADNGKEIKSLSKTIKVKPNSNLYVIENVKLGIKSAHSGIGSFFSCALRKTLAKAEMESEPVPSVDFVFFGLSEEFGYCRFISPDSAGAYSFFDIIGATHTALINVPENSPANFSVADFDAMIDDAYIATLPIAENDDGEAHFSKSDFARVALFETADGRKGAIKVKSFVPAGSESYIYADVKVQKNPKP